MSDKEKTAADLRSLDADRLREIIYARLHRQVAGGTPIDTRGDDRPFEWIARGYLEAETERQALISAILTSFLDELDDDERWPEASRIELLDLLQSTGGEAVTAGLLVALRREEKDGKLSDRRSAAQLLKVLLARGHKGTPDFWLGWLNRLGPDYGGMILGGLALHGIDTVSSVLERLTDSPSALRAVRLYLPVLEDLWGRDAVRRMIKSAWPRLSATAREMFSRRYIAIEAEAVTSDLSHEQAYSKVLWAADLIYVGPKTADPWAMPDIQNGIPGVSGIVVSAQSRSLAQISLGSPAGALVPADLTPISSTHQGV